MNFRACGQRKSIENKYQRFCFNSFDTFNSKYNGLVSAMTGNGKDVFALIQNYHNLIENAEKEIMWKLDQ